MHGSTLPALDIIAGMRFHCTTKYISLGPKPSLNGRGSGTLYILVVILLSMYYSIGGFGYTVLSLVCLLPM